MLLRCLRHDSVILYAHSVHHEFSDNDLVGDIPKSFLDSISARKPIEVDLSSNRLTGGVPIELDR